MLDLNVLLDVLQKRAPHYQASAAVLEHVIHGEEQGALSAHAVTTVHYLVSRYATRAAADGALDWLLRHFHVCAVGRDELEQARSLGWPDFEDAVLACVAQSAGCSYIVTRNIKDFERSPVTALTPQEWLLR
nr:PIN domain-containing protein [Alkalilimnicola ehrlichii]